MLCQPFPQIHKISKSGYPNYVEYYCEKKIVANTGMINTSMFRHKEGMSVLHSGQKWWEAIAGLKNLNLKSKIEVTQEH